MSIYCSIFGIPDEHSDKCKRITKKSRMYRELDDSRPCTCGECPIIYQGSHILPSDNDARDGDFGIAAIPSHITRDGKDDADEGRWHPWLRVHLFGGYQDSVLLTRDQVEKLREALELWLDETQCATLTATDAKMPLRSGEAKKAK